MFSMSIKGLPLAAALAMSVFLTAVRFAVAPSGVHGPIVTTRTEGQSALEAATQAACDAAIFV